MGHRDAYVNGLRAAEAEGFAQGKAGLSQDACRFNRREHRCAWYDGWMRGRKSAGPKDSDQD
jgi:ribosome modulation factor